MGIAVTIIGLAATGWGAEKITTVRPGDSLHVGPYQVTIERLQNRDGPNYKELYAETRITSDGVEVARLEPSKRSFVGRQSQPNKMTQTTEAAIAQPTGLLVTDVC